MTFRKHDRVIISAGPSRGLAGTLAAVSVPMKPSGKRNQIEGDDGETYWFMDHQTAFVPEDSEAGRAVRAAYEAALGPVDLEADLAYAAEVTGQRRTQEVRRATDRIGRHADPRAVLAHLDLIALACHPIKVGAKPPGWIPPTLRAFAARARALDVIPSVVERLRTWFAGADTRFLCGVVGKTMVAEAPADPRLVEGLRELAAIDADPGVTAARLLAGDEGVHADLAKLRIVERDGRAELVVGGIRPEEATRILEAIGARASTIETLDLVRGGPVAYDAIDLDAWLAWPDLARFPRLTLSESFRGGAALERVLASAHLSPDLASLDLTACDIGEKGCKALGKAARLANLRELRIDAGDYDKTKWGPKCLTALFPASGALNHLEQLSIRGWKIEQRHVDELRASGRAPARLQVRYRWDR